MQRVWVSNFIHCPNSLVLSFFLHLTPNHSHSTLILLKTDMLYVTVRCVSMQSNFMCFPNSLSLLLSFFLHLTPDLTHSTLIVLRTGMLYGTMRGD